MNGTPQSPEKVPCSSTFSRASAQRQAVAEPAALQQLPDDELQQHIDDCQWLYLTAYERFQVDGNHHDRDEALLHLHRMNTAILARSPEVLAQRHAEFEDRISQGVDYFQSAHALALGNLNQSASI